jgi:hypothetical protein
VGRSAIKSTQTGEKGANDKALEQQHRCTSRAGLPSTAPAMVSGSCFLKSYALLDVEATISMKLNPEVSRMRANLAPPRAGQKLGPLEVGERMGADECGEYLCFSFIEHLAWF